MLNRQKLEKLASLNAEIVITSCFLPFCCEYLTRKKLAETNKLPFDTVTQVLFSWFCGPCVIWQG